MLFIRKSWTRRKFQRYRDPSHRRTSFCGHWMGILLLRRSTGSILYICLYFPTSAMVMFCFLNYLGWQGSFSSGCEGQTDPPRLDSMPECSSCPEEVILQVPRPRIEPRTLATTPGHFTTTLLGRTKVWLRSQPDVMQSQNLRHHASHNHAIKFCDLHWDWPKNGSMC